MKRKSTLLLAFLLMLYIVPAISAYDNISPDSITSFSETLPDDYMFYPDNETHGSGYADSFFDVSDWNEDGNWDAGDSWSTDGDVLTLECGKDGSSDYDYLYTDVPSITVTGTYYVEVRWKLNTTSIVYFWVRPWTVGWGSGDYTNHYVTKVANEWTTSKFMLLIGAVESVGLCVQMSDANPGPVKIDVDYLRISPAIESGWQNDCSTLEGLYTDTHSDWDTSTVSTDGDIATFTMTKDAETGDNWGEFRAYFDTTTTVTNLEADYYPWWEIRWRYTSIGSGLPAFYSFCDGYKIEEWITDAIIDTWYTSRGNIKEYAVSGSGAYLGFYYACNTASNTLIVEVDWFKVYSIANFTVTQSSTTTDDYLYVDSGVLYSNVDSGYIEANHDSALSVSDTYPIYNLTTSGAAPEFSMYVSEWSTYSANTRGATTSGNITDIKLRFNSNEILSAIKFIEEITMEINIFNELFLSTELWGYFGPVGLVIIGYLLIQKDKGLGIFMIIVDSLVISYYLALVEATPDYWWHIFILLLGVIQCAFQMMNRR